MTLDRFFEEDSMRWTDSHVEALRHNWKGMEKHKLFQYNKERYSSVFENCSDATLEYYIGLEIPHFSQWAKEVAALRI